MSKHNHFFRKSLTKCMFVLSFLGGLGVTTGLQSQEAVNAPSPQGGDRYQLITTSKGLLRIDKASGRVETCVLENKTISCQPLDVQSPSKTQDTHSANSGGTTELEKTPSKRGTRPATKDQEQIKTKEANTKQANDDASLKGKTSLAQENQKLRDTITELKQKLADLENEKSLSNDPNSGITRPKDPKLTLPTDEEVDAAIGYVEKLLKKFRGAAEKFKKELDKPDDLPKEEEREL